jgi:hypothetical protein
LQDKLKKRKTKTGKKKKYGKEVNECKPNMK